MALSATKVSVHLLCMVDVTGVVGRSAFLAWKKMERVGQ